MINVMSSEHAASNNRAEDNNATAAQYRSVVQRTEQKVMDMQEDINTLQDREKHIINDNKILTHRLDEVFSI
jgi:hypothetical protein